MLTSPFVNKIGGECGIRTHAGLLPNGFQDRLVMTTSITLHIFCTYFGAARRSCPPRSHRRFERKYDLRSSRRALRGITSQKQPTGLFLLVHPL